MANAGADILEIKRFGKWKSSTVAENYIDESMHQKEKAADLIHSRISANINAGTSKKKNDIIDETFTNTEFTYRYRFYGRTF